MTDLSNRVHLFAHPSHRDEVDRLFTEILGLPTAASLDPPGYDEPVLVYRFTNGASLSVEFTLASPHDGRVSRGAWLELVVDDLEEMKRRVLEAGLPPVQFAGNDHFYFESPGGQVFRIIDRTQL
jgi:hypothetical protein